MPLCILLYDWPGGGGEILRGGGQEGKRACGKRRGGEILMREIFEN